MFLLRYYMISLEDKKALIVTIRCITYNHEIFIRRCLDGFVMQKTNFRFEAIVHDDASTDGTANIIREYAEKYPEIIKPIIETENQYSKHDGSLIRIMNEHTHGKYVALCEGDDYWTDPYKLQKQVDFLETHSEYSMCFHNAMQHFEDDVDSSITLGIKEDVVFTNVQNRDYTGLEIYKQWIVPTASVVLRKEVLFSELYEEVKNNRNFVVGDNVLFLTCAALGKLRGFSDVMSVYRRNNDGVVIKTFVTKDLESSIRIGESFFFHYLNIIKVFGDTYKEESLKNAELAAYRIMKESRFIRLRCYLFLLKSYPFTVLRLWRNRIFRHIG